MSAVQVAVRARPLSLRELSSGSPFCVEMRGKYTNLFKSGFGAKGASKNAGKQFTFDFSYWSVSESDDHYCNQEQIFEDLGQPVLQSAFEGYNACIFAYGQTGSGKTYTMMGNEDSPGLIPRICRGLYARMASTQAPRGEELSFRTEVSYMEIYNEKVLDLLPDMDVAGAAFKSSQHSLRVREHPTKGPYVEGLTTHVVNDYSGISRLLEHGNLRRATAATKMNDVSSRSHAIFTIVFTQAKYECDMPSETVSRLHLVDLAGSERAGATGAEGERLKEGGNINRSLVCLGTVISSLAEKSGHTGHRKKPFIPYRDSVLTWLLKDSLGGNSKTIMIAAISPAECSYGETLSTLRYSSRAKSIVNKPTVNEDANVKLIRDLRAEIQRLKSVITTTSQEPGESGAPKLKRSQSMSMAVDIYKKEEQVAELTREWAEKWRDIQRIIKEQHVALHSEGVKMVVDSEQPHLVGVDSDILSTGLVFYYIKSGFTTIGSSKSSSSDKPDIAVSGMDVHAQHCQLECRGERLLFHPLEGHCFINHSRVKKPTRLRQGDLVQLGTSTVFRFNHPKEAHRMRKRHSDGLLLPSRYVVPQPSSPTVKRNKQVVSTEAVSMSVTSAAASCASDSQLTMLRDKEGEKSIDWNCQPRTPLSPVQFNLEPTIVPTPKRLSWCNWCKMWICRLLIWMASPFLLLALCVMTLPAFSMLILLIITLKIFGFFQRFWITRWLAAAVALSSSIIVSPMVGFCDVLFSLLFSMLSSLRLIDVVDHEQIK